MSNEQNLDEMLRSLQRSVDDLDNTEDDHSENREDYADISTSDLQKILEERYFSNGATGKHESDSSYELDSDVLAEFSEVDGEDEGLTELPEDEDTSEKIEFAETAEEIYVSDATEEFEDVNELDAPEAIEDTDETDELEQLGTLEDSDSLGELEELDMFEDIASDTEVADGGEDTEDMSEPEALESGVETAAELVEYEDFDDLDVIDMQTDVDIEAPLTPDEVREPEGFDTEEEEQYDTEKAEELEAEGIQTEETSALDKTEEKPEFDAFAPTAPKEKPRSFKALMMDYGRPDPIPSNTATVNASDEEENEIEYETPDVGEILSDFTDDTPTEAEKMNSEMRKLMTSLGCEDELDTVSAEDIGAVYGQFENEQEPEIDTASAEFVENRQSEYKKSILIDSLKLAACALLTVIMFFYDTLPIFDVDFFGLSDYVSYPGAYVIIGTQLLLICAACLWQHIRSGVKGLLTVYPNIYSMAVVLVSSCVVYDMVFFLTGGYKPLKTPMFHFLCGVFLTVVALYSLIMKIRESATYNVYLADVAKFTLSRDKGADSIAEKMYNGGFSKDKKIYSPSPISAPKGFFAAIAEGGSFENVVYSSLILMSVGVGVIFGIILMITERTLEEGAIAAMTTVMVSMPVSAVAAILIPTATSWLRLKKRGIALTGRKMIRKYGAENALVFSDLHLFGKCDVKQIGFVCYEKAQTARALAALNILYSRIGGPMGEVFANIPEEHKAKSIRIRRITRSGIEAVVDKSHILIVGDVSFLRRYGIEFLTADTRTGEDGVLYVSLDGRPTARLKAVYKTEPVFDMLIERLAQEGIHCVIETYDPMISTAFVARHRKSGRAPISVVHKNAADINRKTDKTKKRSDHGLVVLSSRLKLAEAVVWCARLCKIEKILNAAVCSSVGLGFALILAPAIFGVIPCVMQYILFAYILLIFALILAITLWGLPSRSYFSVEEIEREYAERQNKQNNKDKKEKTNK